MQFSLKTLLIAITVAALLLVLPWGPLGSLVYAAAWYLLPAVIVTMFCHGSERQRTFALAAGATYVSVSWLPNLSGAGNVLTALLPFVWVAAAGALGVIVRKRCEASGREGLPPS